jgi:S1-C subfamily serine protease
MPRRGWIGITTGDAPMTISPSGDYVRYYAHPAIISVERDSPAHVAGIVAGDSLIAYDGIDVVGRTLNLNELIAPDRKLGITVRRGGEDKDYQVTVAKAPFRLFIRQQIDGDGPERVERVITLPPGEVAGRARVATGVAAGGFGARGAMPVIVNGEWIGAIPRAGGGFTLSANGVFGASMMTLDPVLAKSLDRPAGVLVRDVPDASIAARAGLQPGDVILAVGGQTVATVGDVQLASVNRAENRSVTLRVMRDKKTRNIAVTWNGPSTSP